MQEVYVYMIDIGPGPGLGAAAAAAWFISEQTSKRASAVLLLRVVVTFQISALLDKCFGAGRMSFITRQNKILSKGWAHVKLWKILFGSLVANSFACSDFFICHAIECLCTVHIPHTAVVYHLGLWVQSWICGKHFKNVLDNCWRELTKASLWAKHNMP